MNEKCKHDATEIYFAAEYAGAKMWDYHHWGCSLPNTKQEECDSSCPCYEPIKNESE